MYFLYFIIRLKFYSSVRLIRRAWYAKVDPDQCDIDDNAIEDRLLRCSNCYVVVHFGCYPVGNVPAGKKFFPF